MALHSSQTNTIHNRFFPSNLISDLQTLQAIIIKSIMIVIVVIAIIVIIKIIVVVIMILSFK